VTAADGPAAAVEVTGEAQVVRGPHHAADCGCDDDDPDTSNCVTTEDEGADR
jgi:hypothetical protein